MKLLPDIKELQQRFAEYPTNVLINLNNKLAAYLKEQQRIASVSASLDFNIGDVVTFMRRINNLEVELSGTISYKRKTKATVLLENNAIYNIPYYCLLKENKGKK